MKDILLIAYIFASMPAGAGEAVLNLNYTHSMRLQNRHIEIIVEDSHQLTLTARGAKGDRVHFSKKLTNAEFHGLREAIAKVDWKRAARDKVIGLDGTSVTISAGNAKATLWTPDYNARERGLKPVVKLMATAFQLAGLDETGVPARTKN